MEVVIKVSELDCKRICALGLRPWEKLDDAEKAEYERLQSFHGASVLHKVCAGEGV